MALGAAAGEVQGLFVRHGLLITAIGLAVGGVAAAGMARLIGTLLFGVSLLRAGVFPRLPSAGYGLALTLLAALAPLDDTPWTSLVHVVAGASVTWLSLVALPAARAVQVA